MFVPCLWELTVCLRAGTLQSDWTHCEHGSLFLTDYWLWQCGWWVETQWPHVLLQEPQTPRVDNGTESLLHLLRLLHVCKHYGAQQPEKVSRQELEPGHTSFLIRGHPRWASVCITAMLRYFPLAQIRNFFPLTHCVIYYKSPSVSPFLIYPVKNVIMGFSGNISLLKCE